MDPAAHEDTVCTIECGPAPTQYPRHTACTGWLRGERNTLNECGCWCHKRERSLHNTTHLPKSARYIDPVEPPTTELTFEEIING